MSTANDGPSAPDHGRQAELDALFGSEAGYWSELYAGSDVLAIVHRYRTSLALRWVDELRLPAASRVLEVGCGAGILSMELAGRAFDVEATDPVGAMLERARARAAQAGVADHIRFSPADVHDLDFDDGAFDLVVGLGVLPWIDRPEAALAEMARVLAPGGHLIVSTNNRSPLHVLADPARLPALAPLRDTARSVVASVRGRGRAPEHRARPITFATPWELAPRLEDGGLRLVRSQAFGFGPFTLLGRQVLPGRAGVDLEERLQLRAEGSHALDRLAAQYLVLARREGAGS